MFYIGEHSNREDLSRLMQLILGCAINCDTKEDYIQNIMSMEESVQHSVMTAIQQVGGNIIIIVNCL